MAGPHLRPEEAMMRSAYCRRLGDGARARRDVLIGEGMCSAGVGNKKYCVGCGKTRGVRIVVKCVCEESRG